MVFRYLFISIVIGFYVLLAVGVGHRQEQKEKLKIVLLTVESLCQDMVTAENTPQLLKAVKKGTRFVNYRAVSGWTGTNMVSLLSGFTPIESGVHSERQSVSPHLQFPLKQLVNNDYTVGGLQPFMSEEIYKKLGLTMFNSETDPLLFLAKQKKQNRPFFFWYHYLHKDLPYTQEKGLTDIEVEHSKSGPIEKVMKQASIHFDEARFTEQDIELAHQLQQYNLREFDSWFGNFWSFFSKGGFGRDTILVVAADHGEEQGERGMAGHLHEEIVRIPLFIWLPHKLQQDHPIGINESAGSPEDIMVTLFDLLDIKPDHPLSGRNLFTTQTIEAVP